MHAANRVDPTVQSQIGAKLRDMYDHVLREPVPDRFLDLLKQLEGGEKGPKRGDGDE